MSRYIEVRDHKNKAMQLQALHDVERAGPLVSMSDVPEGKALLCVVENPAFDAIAYCYNQGELDAFTVPSDNRPKTWFLMDEGLAERLAK